MVVGGCGWLWLVAYFSITQLLLNKIFKFKIISAILVESKAVDGNVNNLLNTIVHDPVLRETVNEILTGSNTLSRSCVSPSTVETDYRSTNANSPTVVVSTAMKKLHADLTVLFKNFHQYLNAVVTR